MRSRILPLAALLLAVGIFFAYVIPLWNGKISDAKAAIASDNSALSSAAQYVARQNQLAAARNAIDPAALAQLATFLPDSVDNVGLILDIDALASRSGLALSNINVDSSSAAGGGQQADAQSMPQASESPVGSVDLNLSASGTYKSLAAFLYGIEHSARLLDVHDLTVKSSSTGVYGYGMTIRIYWLR